VSKKGKPSAYAQKRCTNYRYDGIVICWNEVIKELTVDEENKSFRDD